MSDRSRRDAPFDPTRDAGGSVLYELVSSSCIAEVGYDLSDKTLAVRFHGGREYWYVGIPPATHQALLAAESIGNYFNAQVRDAYPHLRAR